jgi:glycosyltransferase involved in cell wall biosynthesis
MNAPPPELIVVAPAYNEEDVIVPVLREWTAVLAGLNISFQIRLYDDGSTDRTSERIREAFGADPRVVLIEKKNTGHGPTILRGYRESGEAQWLFQIDSDGEMPALPFKEMWRRRNEADFVIANRRNRAAPWPRKIVTWVSRLTVWLLFGSRVQDVNSPYRLMRNSLFGEFFRTIPEDTFAPNLILSGFVSRNRLRVVNIDVPHEFRRAGSLSIRKWRLVKAALRAFKETVGYRMSGRMPNLWR